MVKKISETIAPKDTSDYTINVSEDTAKILVSAKSYEGEDIEITISWLVDNEGVGIESKSIDEAPFKLEPLTDELEVRINNHEEKEVEVKGAIRQVKRG